jgi:hypothetical protein
MRFGSRSCASKGQYRPLRTIARQHEAAMNRVRRFSYGQQVPHLRRSPVTPFSKGAPDIVILPRRIRNIRLTGGIVIFL